MTTESGSLETATSQKTEKVFVIGLDGASFDLIIPWANAGKLPNLNKIMKTGAHGPLQSTIHPITPTAWASLKTGKNPGKHGVFDFYRKLVGTYERRAINSCDVDGESIWSILTSIGKKAIVINVPMTYPVEKINGFMISGLLAPPGEQWREGAFHPSDLYQILLKEIDDYRLEPKERWGQNLDAWIQDLYDVTRKEAKTALYLMKRHEWDFFMVHFQGTDWVVHGLWMYTDPNHPLYDPNKAEKYGNIILEFYQEIDSIVGTLLKELDENVIVFIVSDHGMGPLYKTVHVNSLLEKTGLLAFKKSSLWNPLHMEFWLSKVGLTKERLLALLWEKAFLMRVVRWIWYRHRQTVELSLSDLDWSKTKVYATGHMGQLFINLKGREPQGIVNPGKEYEELRDYLTQMLYDLRDPDTNERIISKVFRKEELYFGDHLNEAPDLIYLASHAYESYNGLETHRDSFISLCYGIQSSKHELDGIFIVSGENVKKDTQIQNISITDIAPTILYILGAPIPKDIDGKVIIEIFQPESELATRSILHKPMSKQKKRSYPLSDEEEKTIVERLKSLGYMG